MREIKFRAWDEAEKEWLCIKHLGIMNNAVWFTQAIDKNENDIDPPYFIDDKDIHLMQYTGLKDKNGVEIYEGDILEYPDLDKGVYLFKEQPKRRSVMKWHEQDAAFKIPGTGFRINTERVEVIGNRFENPELLETKK